MRLAIRALAGGARHRTTVDDKTFLSHLEWNIAGDCMSPVTVECYARPDGKGHRTVVIGPGKPSVMGVTMETKCRNCANCLAKRAAHWRLRALTEYSQSPRTWLGTLTFNPDAYHALLTAARAIEGRQGFDFDALSDSEKSAALNRHGGKHLTDWLKRLRKEGSRFRYMAVVEFGELNGRLHYHVLMHEVSTDGLLRHAALKRQWSLGFSDFKLVTDKRGATYAAKYLAKSKLARVRASIAYGSPRSVFIADGTASPEACKPPPSLQQNNVLSRGLINRKEGNV